MTYHLRRHVRRAKKLVTTHKWASIVVAAGVLLIAISVITWGGGSDKPTAHAPSHSALDDGTDSDDGGSKVSPNSGTSEVVSASNNPFGKTSASSPFLPSNNNVGLHTVTVIASSDGAMNIGFRFRGGHGDGKKIASQTFSLTERVRGGLPIGQIGVQVLYNATYATCSVRVDGVEVASGRTDGGPAHVVVCTG